MTCGLSTAVSTLLCTFKCYSLHNLSDVQTEPAEECETNVQPLDLQGFRWKSSKSKVKKFFTGMKSIFSQQWSFNFLSSQNQTNWSLERLMICIQTKKTLVICFLCFLEVIIIDFLFSSRSLCPSTALPLLTFINLQTAKNKILFPRS